MRPTRTIDAEILARQTRWVRALAQSLVADAHLADDVAQDACVAALSSAGPRQDLRAWLAGVVRNLVRQSLRGASRRREREHTAARAEAGQRVETVAIVLRPGESNRIDL